MDHPRCQRSGFTLIELMVVIAIIMILAGILVPVVYSAKEKARQSTCISNQRQVAMAITIYAQNRDVFPGSSWYTDIDLGTNKILQCPSKDEEELPIAYGMNAYLHGLRQDTIQRPQRTILTCDAETTSTVSGDMLRHQHGAIFSRADGSVVFAKSESGAGQFGAGRFPLKPRFVSQGQEIDVVPSSFTKYGEGEPIANEFLIVGPYGSDEPSMNVSTPSGLLDFDYIGEDEFALLTADDIPLAGETAPRVDDITIYTGDPAGAKVIKAWRQPVTVVDGELCVKLLNEGNYNADYWKRTTYGIVFVYSPKDQLVKMKAMIDDVGSVWLNGEKKLTDLSAASPGSESNTAEFVLPKGINYFCVRLSNWDEGGGKFNISFPELDKVDGTEKWVSASSSL